MKKNAIFDLLVVILVNIFISCDNGTGEVITYSVTFNSNGGSNIQTISGIEKESTIILPNNPTKEYYIFLGWFIDNNTFLNEFTSSTKVYSDITVYAKWKQLDNVVFLKAHHWDNGGTDKGGNWDTGYGVIFLSYFNVQELNSNSKYNVTISGNSDVKIDELLIEIIIINNTYNHITPWHDFLEIPNGTFEIEFEMETHEFSNDLNQNDAFLYITNQIELSDEIQTGTIMAIITNFNIIFEEIL